VAQELAHVDFLDERLAQVSGEIAERVHPDEEALARLDTIPGVGRSVAEALVAVIGSDLTRFPTAKYLASWAGLCPGTNESAGKRSSGKTRKGSPWLRACLVQAAHPAARTKGTYLAAQYRRLAARRGREKAAVAVAHSIRKPSVFRPGWGVTGTGFNSLWWRSRPPGAAGATRIAVFWQVDPLPSLVEAAEPISDQV
jgi:transposase